MRGVRGWDETRPLRILSFGYDDNLLLPDDPENEAQFRQRRYCDLLNLRKTFVVLLKSRGTRRQALADGAVEAVSAPGLWGPFIVGSACLRGIAEGRRRRPHLVEYQEPQLAGLIGLVVARTLKVPLVGGLFNDIVGNEEWSRGSFRRSILDRIGRSVVAQSALVRCDSKEAVERLNRAGYGNVRYVPFYVPWLERFAVGAEVQGERVAKWRRGPLVLCVARLSPEKNIPLLLRAFASVRRRLGRGQLVIVGDGPLRAELEALATKLLVGPHVVWAGAKPYHALPAYYREASLFALSSDNETSARVLLLAMAARLPTVTTNTSGTSDYVFHGRTGEVTPVGDERAFTEALARMMELEAHYVGMLRAHNYSRWERYGDGVITHELRAFYEEAVESVERPGVGCVV